MRRNYRERGKNVIIRISKAYKYPFAMLEKEEPMRDAINKLQQDIVTDLQEGLQNDPQHFFEGFFEVETLEELPFILRNPNAIPARERIVVSHIQLCRELSKARVETQYGVMDPLVNPIIYDIEPPMLAKDGTVIEPERHYLKRDVEKVYLDAEQYYSNVLQNMERV